MRSCRSFSRIFELPQMPHVRCALETLHDPHDIDLMILHGFTPNSMISENEDDLRWEGYFNRSIASIIC